MFWQLKLFVWTALLLCTQAKPVIEDAAFTDIDLVAEETEEHPITNFIDAEVPAASSRQRRQCNDFSHHGGGHHHRHGHGYCGHEYQNNFEFVNPLAYNGFGYGPTHGFGAASFGYPSPPNHFGRPQPPPPFRRPQPPRPFGRPPPPPPFGGPPPYGSFGRPQPPYGPPHYPNRYDQNQGPYEDSSSIEAPATTTVASVIEPAIIPAKVDPNQPTPSTTVVFAPTPPTTVVFAPTPPTTVVFAPTPPTKSSTVSSTTTEFEPSYDIDIRFGDK